MKQKNKKKKGADLQTLKRILKLLALPALHAAPSGALLRGAVTSIPVLIAARWTILSARRSGFCRHRADLPCWGLPWRQRVCLADDAGPPTPLLTAVRDLRRNLLKNCSSCRLTPSRGTRTRLSAAWSDVDQVSNGFAGFRAVHRLITILGTLVFMFSLHFGIALVVVLLTPLSLFVSAFIARHIQAMFVKQAKVQGNLTGYLNEMTNSQKVVKAFGYEARAEQEFDDINRDLYHWGVRAQFYSALTNPVTRFINGVVYAAVGLTGALTVIGGGLTVGGLSSFLSYANQYTKPFNEISGVVAQFQAAIAGAARIFTVLDEAEQTPEPGDAVELQQCEGRVQMEQVAFSYTPGRPLIRDLNVEAPRTHMRCSPPAAQIDADHLLIVLRWDEGTIKVDDHRYAP